MKMNMRTNSLKSRRGMQGIGLGGVVWLLITLALAAGAFSLAGPLAVRQVAERGGSVTAFTAVRELYIYDAGSPHGRLARRTTVARFPSGAVAFIGENFDASGRLVFKWRKIKQPNGQESLVYDDVDSVVRWPQPPQWIANIRKNHHPKAATNCAIGPESLVGHGTVRGIPVDIVKFPSPAPGGADATLWSAPGLGCQILQSRSQVRERDGTLHLTAEVRLVSLTLGEPNVALLSLPATYESVGPSEGLQREVAFRGLPWTNREQTLGVQWDARYAKLKKGDWGLKPAQTGAKSKTSRK